MVRRLTVLAMALGLSLAFMGAVTADGECSGVASVADASCAATCGGAAMVKVDAAECLVGGDVVQTEAPAPEVAKVGYTIGETIEDFTAVHAQTGEERTLASLKGEKATVLIFWNIECPWVIGPRGVRDQVFELYSENKDNGINVVLVDPGVNLTPEQKKEYAAEYAMPVLINQDSSVAARFNATYTPEVFIFDANMKLVYHGAYTQYTGDTDRVYPTHSAVKAVVNSETIEAPVTRGQGCSIKWAPGSRPRT